MTSPLRLASLAGKPGAGEQCGAHTHKFVHAEKPQHTLVLCAVVLLPEQQQLQRQGRASATLSNCHCVPLSACSCSPATATRASRQQRHGQALLHIFIPLRQLSGRADDDDNASSSTTWLPGGERALRNWRRRRSTGAVVTERATLAFAAAARLPRRREVPVGAHAARGRDSLAGWPATGRAAPTACHYLSPACQPPSLD